MNSGINGDNTISLEEWKNQKRDASFCRYLKVLSFSDLMNESHELLDQIKRNEEQNDLLSKTRSMMNEFALRLEKESKHLAHSVKDFKKQIENKLH